MYMEPKNNAPLEKCSFSALLFFYTVPFFYLKCNIKNYIIHGHNIHLLIIKRRKLPLILIHFKISPL